MKAYLVCFLSVIFLFFCYDCQDLQIDPFPIAKVTIGGPLTLTCNYTGTNTPVIIRWFLNNDTTGMIVSKATCNIIGTPGTAYEVSRYAINCYKLTITSISENDINDVWGCTVDFTLGTSPAVSRTVIAKDVTNTTTTSTTTTTTNTVTSSSTSMSSTTSNVTIDNTSTKPTINGSAASATNSTSTSVSPTAVSPANNINNTSTSTNPTISGSTTTNKTSSNGSKSMSSVDIKVIVPAVVVPCGLLIIGAIILLVVLCVRHRAGKNVHENPDGMAIQDKGSNIDKWKQSLGHGKATDNLDAVYTTNDGFIIYPGPAAMSAARSYKDKKYHDVTDQYSRPYPGTYHHQAAYVPSTYPARGYTHKGKKHHGVTDQYSRPSTGTYGYQDSYVPSTYTSARTHAQKGKHYDYEGPIRQPASHLMATNRKTYDQNAYYPQTGYYGQSGEDVYYSGGGQYSYGQRSRSCQDHKGRQKQREYYDQYEMADYGGNRAEYRHTKHDMAFYY